jgi:hypothetical protein
LIGELNTMPAAKKNSSTAKASKQIAKVKGKSGAKPAKKY